MVSDDTVLNVGIMYMLHAAASDKSTYYSEHQ
jgi:hypothetical protein